MNTVWQRTWAFGFYARVTEERGSYHLDCRGPCVSMSRPVPSIDVGQQWAESWWREVSAVREGR